MKHTNALLNSRIEGLLKRLATLDECTDRAQDSINEWNQEKKELRLMIDDMEEAKIVLNSSN